MHLSIYVDEATASFFWELSKENNQTLTKTIMGLINGSIEKEVAEIERKRKLALAVLR